MNWRKWVFYVSMICITIALLTAFTAETNQASYYAGFIVGWGVIALIVAFFLPGRLRMIR